MRGGNECDLWLIAQIEPQPQGCDAPSGHETGLSDNGRSSSVLVGGVLTVPVLILQPLAISTIGITGH